MSAGSGGARSQHGLDVRALAGLVLLLAYATPLFGPPLAPLGGPAPEGSLLVRLFPGVPATWLGVRLTCLLAGAVLLAWSASAALTTLSAGASDSDHATRTKPARTVKPAWSAGPGRQWTLIALGFAALHAVSAGWAGELGATAQALYIGALVVPAALLALASRASRTRSPQASDAGSSTSSVAPSDSWPWLLAAVAVITVWLLVRVPAGDHWTRSADAVDLWRAFEQLLSYSSQPLNFIKDSVVPAGPGFTSTWAFFEGVPVLRAAGAMPGLAWLTTVHALWLALTAAGIAMLGAALIGPAAAPVAAAAFLFSPFALAMQVVPSPLFIGPLLTTLLALAVAAFVGRRSPAGLALLGAIAGLGFGYPALLPVCLLALLTAAVSSWARPRPSGAVVIIAMLSFAAAVIPVIPDAEGVKLIIHGFLGKAVRLSSFADVALGQQSLTGADEAFSAARGLIGDLPAGALLAPFATARASTRLIGDTLFDPLGSALVAAGLAVCLRHSLRDRVARGLVLALGASLATGLVSLDGRVSATQLLAAPVPLALLAAVGFRCLSGGLWGEQRQELLAAVVTVAIMASGLFVFDTVNPKILRRSSVGLAIAALDEDRTTDPAIVTYPADMASWLHVESIARHVAGRPLPVVYYEGPDSLADGSAPRSPGHGLYFWSPALEEDVALTDALCGRWPHTRLYTIVDRGGQSQVHAAQLAGVEWTPAMPASRWSSRACAVRVAGSSSGRRGHKRDGDVRTADDPDEPPPANIARPRPERDGFREADLSRADLDGALLAGEDFSGSDLRSSSLVGAKLSRAILNGARLNHADLREADLTFADLSDADLRGAELAGADLSDATLSQANLSELDFTQTELAGANFHNADLSGAKLSELELGSVNLYGAELDKAKLRDSAMAGLNLNGSTLFRADLRGATLIGAELGSTDFTRARLSGANLAGSRLADANLKGAKLRDTKLTQADLSRAALKRAVLDYSDLSGSRLAGANLRKASLRKATLRGTDLSGANLNRADLAGAHLDGVNWQGAICPDGSRADANGGTCCGRHVGKPPASCSP